MDTVNHLLAHVWVVWMCASAGALMLLWVEYDNYRDAIKDIVDDAQWATVWHERIMDESDGRGA